MDSRNGSLDIKSIEVKDSKTMIRLYTTSGSSSYLDSDGKSEMRFSVDDDTLKEERSTNVPGG